MKMTIEPVSAFSSLDVLVAMDEGLFSAEGLDLQMASRESRDIRSTTEGTLSSPVTNQGRLNERGEERPEQQMMDAVPAFQRRRHVDDPSDQLGMERVGSRRVDPVKLLAGHVVARSQLILAARAPAAR